MRRSFVVRHLAVATGLLCAVLPLTGSLTRAVGLSPAPAGAAVTGQLAQLPLSFVENRGQADAAVAYYAQGADTSVGFTAEGVRLILPGRSTVTMGFVGGAVVEPTGEALLPGTISYFSGQPTDWNAGLQTYGRVVYRNVWPGIDAVFSGTGSQLKSEFHVAPGADPSLVRFSYRGADDASLNETGDLVVRTAGGSFTDLAPVTYQGISGKRLKVESAYVRLPGELPTFAFTVGSYDPGQPLVIDPVTLVYAGFIGGSGTDTASGIAVDGTGAVYVVGTTDSTDATFPETVGPDLTANGGTDAFVAKVDPSGSSLVWAGYIGSGAADTGRAVAVDGSGTVYIGGTTTATGTTSPAFPTVGTLDTTPNGSTDGFVAKVGPTGTSLTFSAYVGGEGADFISANGLAVDGAGAIYIGGQTGSNSPTNVPAGTFPATVGPFLNKGIGNDAFVAKINPLGTAYDFCGYIGGDGSDSVRGLTIDGTGAIYVGGLTNNGANFPVVVGPSLTSTNSDGWVAKVNPGGTALVYSGFVTGQSTDQVNGVAVDSNGALYITGETNSSETSTPPFPVVGSPFDPTYNNPPAGGTPRDAFVAKVKPDGSGYDFAGFFGGSGDDRGNVIKLDGTGNIYVVGSTSSTQADFPVLDGPDLTANGGWDAFVAKFNPAGNALAFSGFIGGSLTVGTNPVGDLGKAVALGSGGAIYVAGDATSSEPSFPALVGPDLTYNGGTTDAYLAKISDSNVDPVVPEVPWALALPLSYLLIFLGFSSRSRRAAGAGPMASAAS